MSRTLILLHRLARWFVLAAVVLSPWLFAGAEGWACTLLGLLVLAGAGFWLFSLVCYPSQVIRVPGMTAILGAALLLMVLQFIPFPERWVRAVSPMSADVASAGRQVLDEQVALPETARVASAPAGQITVSVAPLATRRSLFVFVFCVAALLVMVNCTNTWHELRREARIIVIGGFVLAVVSLVHKLSGVREMLWFHTPRYGGNFFGPFTNRNHFGCHLDMIFGLAVGLVLASTTFQAIYAEGDWRSRMRWFSTKRASQTGLLVFVAVVIGATVVMTLSRGATMSLVAALIATTALAAFRESERRHRKIILALILLVVGGVMWLGWQPVADRLSTLVDVSLDPYQGSRLATTADTLLIMGACPFLGAGFGAFQHVFPIFARPELAFGLFTHAHDDWAELLAEGGFAAGFLALFFVFLFARQFAWRFPLMRVHPRRFVLGCLISLIAVAVHSFFDYSLHKPANVLLLAIVAGMALAAVHLEVVPEPETEPEADDSEESPAEDPRRAYGSEVEPPVRTAAVRLGACVLLVGLILMIFTGLGGLRAGLAFKRLEQSERLFERLNDPARLEQTAHLGLGELEGVLESGDADQFRETGAMYLRWATDRRLSFDTRMELAKGSLRSAMNGVLAAPSDYLAWLWLARAQALLGQWDHADRTLERARQLRPRGGDMVLFPDRD